MSPAWIRCPCCDDYLCTIHGGHVHDCPCPPIEEWDHDPYAHPQPERMRPMTTYRRWETYAAHDTPALNMAGAGSSRIYYESPETGEVCYRHASWGQHGTGVHGFRDAGIGKGVDRETLTPNGLTYPESEF